MLELQDVTKQYEAADQCDSVTVLKGITLSIQQGQSVAMVGPSGCGKSTLLNLIGGLDTPTQGRVSLDGQDLASLNESEIARFRNQKIGFIFQLHHLLPQLTALENVLVPTLAVKGESHSQQQSRAKALLDRVGLSDFITHRPAQLSGGQRQRVAVARALINQPKVLLADEPTGSLDQVTAEQIGDLLVDVHKAERVTLIMVTHAMALAQRMDQIYKLENGKIISNPQSKIGNPK